MLKNRHERFFWERKGFKFSQDVAEKLQFTPSNSCMPYQHFTKQPLQLTSHNNNLFITYFRNKNQNLLLRKGCTDSATSPQGHRCHHTPPFDLFSHPPHQQQIRWHCTRRLRAKLLKEKRDIEEFGLEARKEVQVQTLS